MEHRYELALSVMLCAESASMAMVLGQRRTYLRTQRHLAEAIAQAPLRVIARECGYSVHHGVLMTRPIYRRK